VSPQKNVLNLAIVPAAKPSISSQITAIGAAHMMHLEVIFGVRITCNTLAWLLRTKLFNLQGLQEPQGNQKQDLPMSIAMAREGSKQSKRTSR
jgi:hypothetical protein